jgi:hypothetical protein
LAAKQSIMPHMGFSLYQIQITGAATGHKGICAVYLLRGERQISANERMRGYAVNGFIFRRAAAIPILHFLQNNIYVVTDGIGRVKIGAGIAL